MQHTDIPNIFFLMLHIVIDLDKGKGNVKVKLSLCFNWSPRHEGVLGSWGIAPRILDLGTRRRRVVSFTLRPLYPQGKCPWYPLDKRLGGLQSRSGRGGEEKNSQPLPGIEPPIIQPVAQRYATELSRLSFIVDTNLLLTDSQ
jgi:hypothetical protein